MNKASVPLAGREAAKGVLLPRCILCERVPPEGIRGMVKIRKVFICTSCEQQLLHSDVGSTYYRELLNKIKQILK